MCKHESVKVKAVKTGEKHSHECCLALLQVKPEAAQSGQEGEQRHGKIVSEVFLTRLLSTKVPNATCMHIQSSARYN